MNLKELIVKLQELEQLTEDGDIPVYLQRIDKTLIPLNSVKVIELQLEDAIMLIPSEDESQSESPQVYDPIPLNFLTLRKQVHSVSKIDEKLTK